MCQALSKQKPQSSGAFQHFTVELRHFAKGASNSVVIVVLCGPEEPLMHLLVQFPKRASCVNLATI
jgi:hypothetical protein